MSLDFAMLSQFSDYRLSSIILLDCNTLTKALALLAGVCSGMGLRDPLSYFVLF